MRTLISGTAGAACLLLLIGWAVSRLVTDHWRWSQYPWWVPTWAWSGAAAVILAISGILAVRTSRVRGRSPGARGRRAGALGVLAIVAYFGLIECRVYRLIAREPQDRAVARAGGLRVLFWNPSSTRDLDITGLLNLAGSDLAIVANPAWDRSFSPSLNPSGWSAGATDGRFVVMSRCPILRWGSSSTRPVGLPEDGDAGRAMWLEIETTPLLGRPIVIWLLDLPSSWRNGRVDLARQVAAALREWPGPALIPDGRGGITGREPMTGFPAPDLVIGDLNVPRGSGSLSVIAPGTTGAYEQAGAGYVATFPRRFPLVHIDQILTGPGLKATDYRVIDPQHTRHLMQWARIEAR